MTDDVKDIKNLLTRIATERKIEKEIDESLVCYRERNNSRWYIKTSRFLITKDQLPKLLQIFNISQYLLKNVFYGEKKKVPHGTL